MSSSAEAGGRLVQQQEIGLERERGGELERALAAIGQLARGRLETVAEPDIGQERIGARIERGEAALGAPEMEGGAERPLQRHAHILAHRQMGKHGGDLKGADHAEPRHMRRPLPRDVAAVEDDPAGRRLQEFGEQVEDRGLAGAVRADERVNRAAPHLEIDVADCGEAKELLGQPVSLEDEILQRPGTPRPLGTRDPVGFACGCCAEANRFPYPAQARRANRLASL